MSNLAARLFPFKRGLTHAYWAPNFWALYSAADRLLALKAAKKDVTSGGDGPSSSPTSGLVQDSAFGVLPQVPPIATFAVTAAVLIPVFVKLWQHPRQPIQFIRALIICSFTSFMFGW